MNTWLCLHDFGGSGLSWAPLAAALGEPCIRPDLRGFGDAPPGPEPMDGAARNKLRAAWGDPAAAREVAQTVSRHRDGPAYDRIVGDHLRASRGGLGSLAGRPSKEDLRGLARQVDVPVLVAAGADDASLGPAVQEQHTLPSLPGATMRAVPGSRHLVPLDAPVELAAVMRSWVSEAGLQT